MNAVLHAANAQPQPRENAPVPLLRTLVLCDLADSTALVERLGDLHAAELFRKHDRFARTLVHQYGGREIDKTDGFLMMFDRPIEAVKFALAYQRGLHQLDETAKKVRLLARIGIHVGDVLTWDNTPADIAKGAKPFEIEGLVKPTTSRLMQLALPGQILLSGIAYQLAHRSQDELGDAAMTTLWRTHGRYRFKGLPDPVAVFEVGEQGIAPLKAPPWSGKAHREVPFWRRPGSMAIEIAVMLALVALPLWYLLRPEPAIAFAQRDWVVVGDLKNLTDESSFDDSLEEAFRIGLEQSRYVNVLSDLKARDTVKLMQRDPEQTKVDRAIGSEVAIRNGARALVLPTVAEIGGRVRVTAEVIDPHTQTTVWSESADGTGAASVLPSLDKVNQKLRVRLGEALATVSNESQPLDKVATKNLDALRAYSLGERAYSSNSDEAMQLFRQALRLDPQFALAHVSIARLLTNDSQDDAAIKELDLALALREHLPPRDALYVEALRETFGPPRPALEKWKLLANLYPDFFPGQGAYGYFAWELANRYSQAIQSAKIGASPQNAHRAASQYLLGTLYLGNEQYADALREFDEFNAVPGTPVGFHAAAFAAQRSYDKSEALLASTKREPTDATLATSRAIFALDQGRWSEGREIIRNARAQPKLASAQARQLNSIDLSLAALESKATPAFAKAARDILKAERDAQPAPVSQAARSDSEFRILLAAYLAAKADDVESARTILSSAGPITRDPDYPVLLNLRDVVQSELARAEHRPDDAIKTLVQRNDGTELYVTHVALMDAYAASAKPSEALREAEWLATHRGRAYTEYGAEWVMTAFNVVQSDLALLRASELARSAGQADSSRQWRDQFIKAWPGAAKVPFVAPRLAAEAHP
jgi:putative peptide modification system cyclase